MLLASVLAVPAVLLGPAAALPQPSPAELDALGARLSGAAADDRRSAAMALAALPAGAVEAAARRLDALGADPAPVADGAAAAPISTAVYRALLLEIGALVPNPSTDGPLYVTRWDPPPHPRGRKPRRVRRVAHPDPETLDWLDALSTLDLAASPTLAALPEAGRTRAIALEAVALLRALGASGRAEAFAPVFDFAFVREGVFRDECGRALRSLGAVAVPDLIHRMHLPGRGLGRQRRYAAYQLDRMDRARPRKAIAAVTDDRIKAAMLREYGAARALDAVEAVLGQIDAPSRQVRREARAAWLRYVSGPPPPPAPKRRRKLAGGGTESEEKEDYLNSRALAEIVLAQHVADLQDKDPAARGGPLDRLQRAPGAPAPVDGAPDAEELTRALYQYYDGRHAAEWQAQYAAAADQQRRGALAEAVASYAAILARDPTYPHREEMARAYQALGVSLLPSDPARGLSLLRQAAALDPALATRLDAELSYREAERLRVAGHPEPSLYRRALTLAPGHSGADAALSALHATARQRTAMRRSGVAGLAGLLLLLGAVCTRWRVRTRASVGARPG